jgi:hypothetical protein
MAERQNAEFAQITVGQSRKQARVDVVVPERLLILTKSQVLQPRFDVYRIPMSGPRASPKTQSTQ